jgi:hypothetical protein
MRMTTTLLATALLIGVFLIPTTATADDEPLTATEAKAIAKEAFFWGMHPVGITIPIWHTAYCSTTY